MAQQTTLNQSIFRPPIVTILGHVDHGKTTLLDTIRKTNIAEKEFGGITQHIGAYQVEVARKKITFIDTPGHQAFAKMRSRGAKVADIAILVIAGNDGIMPQTEESLEYIKAAKIPFIVAINKIDLPDINIEKIKKRLSKMKISLEEFGGETPVIPLSAKTGKGVDKLLQMILLLAELNQIKDDNPDNLQAVVIESSLSKNRGPLATVVVRSGSLSCGDEVICDDQEFRIRSLNDWRGKKLNKISAGETAEILGWEKVAPVGSLVLNRYQLQLAQPTEKELTVPSAPQLLKLPDGQSSSITQEKIKFIIKADTVGSLEAILNLLTDKVKIIHKAIGNISEADILLAKTVKAIVVGFNVKPEESVIKLASSEKVIIKTYKIIYELADEIEETIEAIRLGNLVNILGEAKIIALFPIKNEIVAGVKVIKGRIARGDQVKITRGKSELGRARIKSLRRGKEDITRAEQGIEAGVLLSQKVDILTGDSIISIG